jgi:hypothetical protein
MFKLLRRWKHFRRAQQGVAYLEFAVTLPFLLALFMGSVDATRYILIAQKLEKVSLSMADLVAQYETMSTTQLNTLILATGQVMRPYDFGANSYVVVSSITKTGTNAPVVNWQYAGGGTMVSASRIGATGNAATLPAGFTMVDKDNIIIAEVFYNYTSLVAGSVMPNVLMYKMAVFKPRLGALNTLGS